MMKKANPKSNFEEKIVWRNVISHEEALEHLQKKFGKEKCLEMIRKSKPLFDYLIKDCRLGRAEILKADGKEMTINNAVPAK